MNPPPFRSSGALCGTVAAVVAALLPLPVFASGTAAAGGSSAVMPPVWLVTPFMLLLLMIATGPILYPRFWEHHYRKVSIFLGSLVALYYAVRVDNGIRLLEHTFEEYLSFISLIAALFVVAGGILIRIERRGTPLVNALLLFFGAVLANIVGTTGASMLLIRPYLRINAGRLRAFHTVFFIFIVSNAGGCLTPVGDPPLFLGFLRGVPFFWVLRHLWLPWLLTVLMLCLILMALDARTAGRAAESEPLSGRIVVRGSRNFLYLALLMLSVFLDPSVIPGFPSLHDRFHLPFGIREAIMVIVAFTAYKTSDREALEGNGFNFEPIIEVGFLFVGIFATMIPALQLIGDWAGNHAGEFTVTKFYWCTGLLSGFLDNAPTYLNFLAGATGKFGLDAGNPSHVRLFSEGLPSPVPGDASSTIYLMAISMASVLFGAFTYIGNAPNFMVRNIALQSDAEVPGFLEYLYRYSIPVLIPLLAVLWFFQFNY